MMFISMHSILGWASFCMNYCINAAWHRGNQPVALLRCNEAQVALIAAFRSSALLGSGVSHLLLVNTPKIIYLVQVRRVCWAIKHSNTIDIETALVTFGSVGRCWSPAGKWNQHLHKACQQKEAWSALTFPGRWLRWLWTSENTADQHQQMTWQPKSSLTVETSLWTSSNMDSVSLSTLPPDSETLIYKWNAKCTFIWKEDFGPLSNSPVLLLLSPGKMLLTMFLFQKWFGSSFPEDVWAWWLLMHWLQLQFTPWKDLPSVWISFAWMYSQACRSSLLLVHILLPNFFLPVNFAFNMLWYSTPWTATLFSNDPLWCTLFMEGVNDHNDQQFTIFTIKIIVKYAWIQATNPKP